jgi:hypothetical protein
MKLEGDAHLRAVTRLAEIDRTLKALTIEAPRRLDKAMQASVAKVVAARQQQEDLSEINRRTAKQVREDAINEVVARRVAMQKNAL